MDITLFLLIIPALTAAFALWLWSKARSSAMLDCWADENGYTLVEKKYCHFFRGPFFFTASKAQDVYRITARDKAGELWTGWAKCGGYWSGLISDQVKVRWDEARAERDTSLLDRWLDG
jgi:hypothetical protein